MPVDDQPPPWDEELRDGVVRSGHQVDASIVALEIYRLLALVLADERITELLPESSHLSGHPIVSAGALAEDEITRLLLSTAIMLRAHDEGLRNRPPPRRCGTLVGEGAGAEPLLLREACNKIIHATEIRFRMVQRGSDPERSYVTRTLYLGGTHRSTRWRVALDVVSYAEAGFELAYCTG